MLNKFELIVDGFDGSTDETDDHVIWVVTELSREALASALPPHVSICDSLHRHFAVDYDLPRQMDDLAAKVKQIMASHAQGELYV